MATQSTPPSKSDYQSLFPFYETFFEIRELFFQDQAIWNVIQLDLDRLRINRDAFIEKMAEKGIGTSVHFIPLHLQPYWRDRYGFKPEDFPVALDCFKRIVSLPIYSRMTDEDVETVIEAVKEIVGEFGR